MTAYVVCNILSFYLKQTNKWIIKRKFFRKHFSYENKWEYTWYKKAKYLSMDYSIYQINISILLTNMQQLKYKQKDFNYIIFKQNSNSSIVLLEDVEW